MQSSIAELEAECVEIKSDIRELESEKIVFSAGKCELCRQALDLPTLHFRCKHSFHARCLGDMTQECPRFLFIDFSGVALNTICSRICS